LATYSKMQAIVIRCAKCKKPVDESVQEADLCNMELVFKVRCHGEWDGCRVWDDFFHKAKIISAEAFTSRKVSYEAKI